MAIGVVACPLGVIAGEMIIVDTACPEGYTQTVTVTGPFTDYTVNPITGAISIPTQTASAQEAAGNTSVLYGFVVVGVTCTPPPDSGLPPIIGSCSTEVIDPNEYLDCDECDPACIEVQHCELKCYCTEITVKVINCDPICESAKISSYGVGVVDEVPPVIEPCDPLEAVALAGTKPAWIPENIEEEFLPDDCDEEGLYCLAHKPSLIWNNVCGCPGWVVSGAGIDGTDASNACGCIGGSPWRFNGSGSMTASGPAEGVDIAVIWQHNIVSGSVTTSPAPFGGNPASINLCYDSACIDGFTRPIVIPFDGLSVTGSVSMDIVGTTADGGPIEIGYILFGRKLILPEEALRVGFVNPHNGCDTEIDIKENECGDIIQTRLIRKRIPLALNVACVNEEWTRRYWRAYIRYLSQGNPVLFQWSINRAPDDLFFGIKTNASSSYTSAMHQSLQLNAEGYISQRQIKAFA